MDTPPRRSGPAACHVSRLRVTMQQSTDKQTHQSQKKTLLAKKTSPIKRVTCGFSQRGCFKAVSPKGVSTADWLKDQRRFDAIHTTAGRRTNTALLRTALPEHAGAPLILSISFRGRRSRFRFQGLLSKPSHAMRYVRCYTVGEPSSVSNPQESSTILKNA